MEFMKKEIDETELNILERLKNKMLIDSNGYLLAITDFKIIKEEVEINTRLWFSSKTKKVEKLYLTDITVSAYNIGEKFLGVVNPDFFSSTIIYRVREYRKKWLDLKEQLEGFGFTLTKKQTEENNENGYEDDKKK